MTMSEHPEVTYRFVRVMLKGSPEYRVERDGVVFATAHCANLKTGVFTIVRDKVWQGISTEDGAVAILKGYMQ
jgi:hypothetical protein